MRLRRPSVYPFARSLVLSILVAGYAQLGSAEESNAAPRPVTIGDPDIPAEELALLLVPLTKNELLIEADGWQGLVKARAEEIARAEIAVKRQNTEIEKARDIQEQADQAKHQLEVAKEKAAEAKVSGDADKVAEAGEAAEEAQATLKQVSETVDDAVEAAEKTEEIQSRLPDQVKQGLEDTGQAADQAEGAVARLQETIQEVGGKSENEVRVVAARAADAAEGARDATERVADEAGDAAVAASPEQIAKDAATIGETASAMQAAQEGKEAAKVDLLENVTALREARTRLLDNLRTAVDELEAKTDKEDTDTQASIRDYRLYISGVSGINLDVTDSTSAWVSIKGWVTSEEGGLRWVRNIATFSGILILAWVLSRVASGLIGKGMSKVRVPALLSDFMVKAVRWLVMIIGVIWALSALEVSIAPLLALVGAAGLVIAFAMQDSLSNFASGLMILLFRPFDTGDVVDAGGVSGTVRSMNLVSTTIRTFDNKMMVVPNSKIWGEVITNASNATERRVDMEFGIGYDDDADRAQQILEEIVSSHPNVLKEPAPTIRMNALADSSVNFICRPWAKTADYWGVYWDVTREVKRRFDAEGIGIPFPQQDVHLYVAEGPAKEKLGKLAAT